MDNSTLMTNSESVIHDIHRQDSKFQIEDNYYINYIDDRLIHSDFKTTEINEAIKSILNEQEHSCQLELSHLPNEIFIDENVKREFECIVHEFDPLVTIIYSEVLQRVLLTFSNPTLTLQVYQQMNGREFYRRKMKLSYVSQTFSSIQYLQPPKAERIYMQSPPTTPPVGWLPKYERLSSDINFDLFLALSKLHPNEPLEILPQQNHCPAIIVHPCSDTSDSENEHDHEENINTPGFECDRKNSSPIASKQCVCVLHHNSILTSNQQQVDQSAGDGDRLMV